MRSHTICPLSVLFLAVGALCAQAAEKATSVYTQTAPAFDVATIRANNTGSHSWSIDSDAGYFTGTNVPLMHLLENAYGIRADLISGEPDWVDTTHYDVRAKSVDADPAQLKHTSNEQQQAMLLNVLVDRFHLSAHIESKQMPVYDLIFAKGGQKLKPVIHPAGEDVFHGVGPGGMSTHNGHLVAHGISIGQMSAFIAKQVRRTVVDKTGLTGAYDVLLDFAPDHGDGPAADATDPPLFSALQQQLGLKLESAKGPVETLVIDHIEKPTEN